MDVYVVFMSLFTLLQSAILRVQSQAAPSAAQHVQSYPLASSETLAQPTGPVLSTPQPPLAHLQGVLTAPQAMNPSTSQTAESNVQTHVYQPASVPQSAQSYHPTAELANAQTFPPVVAVIPSQTEAALPACAASGMQHVSSAPAQPHLQQTPANVKTDGQLHDFSNVQQTTPVHLSQAGPAPSFQQVHSFQPSAKLVLYLPNV